MSCYSQGLRLRCGPFFRASSLGRVCGSGGGLTAWTRLGNRRFVTWVLWPSRHRINVYIHVHYYMHVHTRMCLPTAADPDGGTGLFSYAWKCLVGLRIRSRGSDIFNSFLPLFIIEPPNTYVLRNQCCLHTRSRLKSKRDLGETALVEERDPLRPGWLTAQSHLNISSQASYHPPRLLSWFLRMYPHLDPPDTVAAGREAMHQRRLHHRHRRLRPLPRRRP